MPNFTLLPGITEYGSSLFFHHLSLHPSSVWTCILPFLFSLLSKSRTQIQGDIQIARTVDHSRPVQINPDRLFQARPPSRPVEPHLHTPSSVFGSSAKNAILARCFNGCPAADTKNQMIRRRRESRDHGCQILKDN